MTSTARPLVRRLLAAPLLFLGLTACLGSSSEFEEVTTYRWIEPSPQLLNQIQDEIRKLPWTRGFERVEQIRWLASVGEPAYAELLLLVEDPRDDVAAAGLAALGATLDRRLVEPIKSMRWSKAREESDLGFERARTLVRLGDWEKIPVLIRGLEDERVYTRTLCIETLFETTRQELEYDPRADEASRAEAVKRWRAWWVKRKADGMLQPRP
ncbi:MAG: hypothetical protein WD226_14250 [Planctomycetota bacterium]